MAVDMITQLMWTRPDPHYIQDEDDHPAYSASIDLAKKARYAQEYLVCDLAQQALSKALDLKNTYRSVSACAWTLRALIERGFYHEAKKMLVDVLDRSRHIYPPASRSEALFLVLQATLPGGEHAWKSVFVEFFEASVPYEHRRQGRNMKHAIIMVAQMDGHLARWAATRLDNLKLRRNIFRLLAEYSGMNPRAFF